jgi:hypothetical protein
MAAAGGLHVAASRIARRMAAKRPPAVRGF